MGLGVLLAMSVGCLPSASPGEVALTSAPLRVPDVPAAAAPEEPPPPACGPVAVAAGLSAQPEALERIRGAIDGAFASRSSETSWCPVEVVAVRVVDIGARVDVRVEGGEASLVPTFLVRRGRRDWTVDHGAALRAIEAERVLDRATAVLEAHPDVKLRHSRGDGDPALTIAHTEQDSILCATESDWTRCFAGPWPDDERVYLEQVHDSDALCLERNDGTHWARWSFDPPEGALRWDCAGSPRSRRAGSTIPAPAEPIVDAAALGDIRLTPLGPGSAAFQLVDWEADESWERICLRAPRGLLCEDLPPPDDVLAFGADYAALPTSGDADSSWVGVQRQRTAEGGAEENRGDHSVLLFRPDGDRLRLHGVLPIGGYSGERFGEAYPDFIWETISVSSDAELGQSGCVTVETTAGRTIRDHRKTKKGRRPKLAPAPNHISGEDEGVYDLDIEVDASGHWMPSPAGGFDKVGRCPK